MQSLFGAGVSFPHFKASGGGGANERCQQSKKKYPFTIKFWTDLPSRKHCDWNGDLHNALRFRFVLPPPISTTTKKKRKKMEIFGL